MLNYIERIFQLQLSSLVKRVELNRTLLERANQRIKELNFLAERNRAISIRDMNYGEINERIKKSCEFTQKHYLCFSDEESFLKMRQSGDTSKDVVSDVDLTAVSHPAVGN